MNKQKIFNILKNAFLILIVICLFVIIYYQNRDRGLSKIFNNENSAISKENDASMEGYLSGDICRVDDKVAFLTTTSYSVVDKDGESSDTEIAISQPVINSEGNFVIYYSKDSKEATVCKKESEYYTLNVENRIIKSKVNRNGYALVVTEKDGYSSEILVFNKVGEPIFKWDLSKSEILDADINSDNNKIAVSVLETAENKMRGKVMLIDITDATVRENQYFESEVLYNVEFNRNGTFIAVGNEKLAYFNADGTLKWEHSYDGKTLLKADISNPDMMVLAFSATGSGVKGNSTDIEVINRLGKAISEKTVDGLADDISVNNKRIAIAFGRTVKIYDQNLKEKDSAEAETGIKRLVFYDDDKNLFVLGNTGGNIIKVR